MKNSFAVLIWLTLGCGPSEMRETPETSADGRSGDAQTVAPPAPDTFRDTISLEGMPEPILLRRFEAPASFPLHFSTYVPADMVPDIDPATAENPGAGLRFVANFGGTPNENVFVHVFVYPAGATLAEVLATARAFIESRGVPMSGEEPTLEIGPRTVRRYGWSVHEEGYRYQLAAARWVVGTLALGQHGGRYFHIVTQYPEEYGDGFGPRAALIFQHWRWEDGSSLGQ